MPASFYTVIAHLASVVLVGIFPQDAYADTQSPWGLWCRAGILSLVLLSLPLLHIIQDSRSMPMKSCSPTI